MFCSGGYVAPVGQNVSCGGGYVDPIKATACVHQ